MITPPTYLQWIFIATIVFGTIWFMGKEMRKTIIDLRRIKISPPAQLSQRDDTQENQNPQAALADWFFGRTDDLCIPENDKLALSAWFMEKYPSKRYATKAPYTRADLPEIKAWLERSQWEQTHSTVQDCDFWKPLAD